MLTFHRIYTRVLATALVAMLAILLAVMSLQIVLRYGFASSLIWAEETCRYLLVWVSFLGAALAHERGELAAVPILRDALPRAAGLGLAILANLCGIALLVVLAWYGTIYAQRMGGAPIPAMGFLLPDLFGPEVPIPRMVWVYAALPVGLGLLALRLAVDIGHYLYSLRHGGRAADLRDIPPPDAAPGRASTTAVLPEDRV